MTRVGSQRHSKLKKKLYHLVVFRAVKKKSPGSENWKVRYRIRKSHTIASLNFQTCFFKTW
jgi:hypothetical protein